MTGLADLLAALNLGTVQKHLSLKLTIIVMLTGALIASLIFHFEVERSTMGLRSETAIVPILIFTIRLFVKGAFGMGYYCNVELFPVLMRSKAFSVTNVLSRSATTAAPILVEYMKNVSLLIVGASIVSFSVPFLITTPRDMNKRF